VGVERCRRVGRHYREAREQAYPIYFGEYRKTDRVILPCQSGPPAICLGKLIQISEELDTAVLFRRFLSRLIEISNFIRCDYGAAYANSDAGEREVSRVRLLGLAS
jgi:hypothetical protein